MSSNFVTFRNYARVQDAHDKAFDKAFALKREAERILRLHREKEARGIRRGDNITVSSEKRNLPF